MHKSIKKYLSELPLSPPAEDRKASLMKLVNYIQEQIDAKHSSIQLNFICTHNSRRSHFAQVWAQAMASYYGLEQVHCFSGGTEATAVYPQVLESLKAVGFDIEKLESGKNSIYAIDYENEGEPIIAFSKKYDDPFNPDSDFAAIMVCDSAYEACPVVHGSDEIIGLSFKDPKAYDNSSEKAERYKSSSEQIALEMKWVFQQINS